MIIVADIPYLQQALYEMASGERLLDHLLQEGAYLKIRLSEVIDGTFDAGDIITAEYFQTLFIQMDVQLNHLRSDIVRLNKMIRECMSGKNTFHYQVSQHQKRLSQDLDHFGKYFSKLQKDFNGFAKKNYRGS